MLVVLFAVVAISTAMQAATGFGFSMLAAPVLYAALEPKPALGLMCVLGLSLNLMTLLTEGRRPHPLAGEAATLVAWAVPGALVGVAVLRSVSAVVLQVMLSFGVIATLAVRHALTRPEAMRPVLADGPHPRPAWSAPLAGLASGALGASTSTNGPPLLLHLLGRGARPSVVRDTLTVCFVAMGLVTPLALLVTWTTEAVPSLRHVGFLIPAVVVGHLVGRRLFGRLARSERYELVVTVVLLISVVAGLMTVM